MFSRLVYGARNTVGIAFADDGARLPRRLAARPARGDRRRLDRPGAQPDGRRADGDPGADLRRSCCSTILGTSIVNMILVIALIDATRVFRLARAVAMNIVVMDYIEAARLRGEGLWHLIRREILPNAAAPLVAEFGLRFCFVFLSISALSFLGLGIQPPTADWGSMVRDNATLITFGDITPLLPAGRHRAPDGGGQLRGRLDAAPRQRAEGDRRMDARQARPPADPRPAHRGTCGRDLERHRPRRRPHAAQGRGHRPDRRVRRRQVDARARRHGLRPRRLPHRGGQRRLRRHRSRAARPRACGAACAGGGSPTSRSRRRRASTRRTG